MPSDIEKTAAAEHSVEEPYHSTDAVAAVQAQAAVGLTSPAPSIETCISNSAPETTGTSDEYTKITECVEAKLPAEEESAKMLQPESEAGDEVSARKAAEAERDQLQ